MEIKPNTAPFWNRTKSGWSVHSYRLKHFLELYGFGQFQTNKTRTSVKSLFHDDEGILKVHDKLTIKTWVREFLENTPDEEFGENGVFAWEDQSPDYKWDILAMWQEYSDASLQSKILNDFKTYSEEGFPSTKRLNLFRDKDKVCHIRFRNGVVKITAANIELLSFGDFKGSGAVWESEIIDHEIEINAKNQGSFAKFCHLAMHRKNPNRNIPSDWRKEYEMDEDATVEYNSMKQAYGFLLHTHNTSDVSKCIYFIDTDSDLGRPQGGNGKSVVMGSIAHYKKMSTQDGKRFRNSMDGGGQFQFSDVDVDTKFVLIDDVRPEFSFDMLFSMITGDMEVERKGRDKFVIPKEKKPKFAVTTNYVIPGTGTSYTRRQHIVEFGNYWNRLNEEKERPSDKRHLGQMLFDDFDEQDWNDFYSFGFRCVQQYFQEGLIQSPKQNYQLKALRAEIEGSKGDGRCTDWIQDWIDNKRVAGDFHKGNGIPEDELYQSFFDDNTDIMEDAGGVWNRKLFSDAVWKYVEGTSGLEYNPNRAAKGNTKSSRRWLVGPAGSQKPHILIT